MFNMTKKMKKKGNKKGSMLVIVCLIIAMALVFIVSAMTVTVAARNRYYDNAKKSQARLTVNAVAESFYEALQIQQITDLELVDLADKGATMSITGGNMPGVVGSGCNTTARFSKDSNYIYVDFTTKIDTTTERLRLVLQGSVPAVSPDLNNFPIELGAPGNLNQLDSVGGGGASKADNIFYIHGGTPNFTLGTATYYSTIFTLSPFATVGNKFTDIVCWGNGSGWNCGGSSGSGISSVSDTGVNMFYFGDGGNMITNSSSISTSVSNIVYQSGRNNNWYSGSGDSSGINIVQMGNESDDLKTLSSRYQNVGEVPFYTGAEAKQIVENSGIHTSVPSGAQEITIPSSNTTTLVAGDYILNTSFASTGTQRRIICDCKNGAINIYVTESVTLQSCYFDICNDYEQIGKFGNRVNFILSDGVSLTFNKGNGGMVTGIFSCPRGRTVDGNGIPVALTTVSLPSNCSVDNSGTNDYCPSCYIYGFSNNSIKFWGGSTFVGMDAYVNLYGGGNIVLNCDNNPTFYGRITATDLIKTSGNMNLPYCPKPPKADKGSGSGGLEIRTSNYSAVQYIYYYEPEDI